MILFAFIVIFQDINVRNWPAHHEFRRIPKACVLPRLHNSRSTVQMTVRYSLCFAIVGQFGKPAMITLKTLHRLNVSILTLIILLMCQIRETSGQHIIGTYKTSAPDASMFFLNPGYLSPAFGGGVMGMHSNPAGLYRVKGTRLSFDYATAQNSSSSFSFQAPQENDLYLPFRIDTQIDLKEVGGLGAVGFAHRTGSWVWGINIMQARTGSLSLLAQGNVDLETQFELDTPITREQYPDLPVEEIPVLWDVNTTGQLMMHSTPAEVSISSQPIMIGGSVEKGPFSLGFGLTYVRYYSSKNMGELTSQLDANAVVTGRPYGIAAISNNYWDGNIIGDLTINDDPILAQYQFDISGHRFAFSLGGMMNFKLFSLGLNYTHGLPSSVKGAYNITTISTVDLQDRDILKYVDLDLSVLEQDGLPFVQGRARLELADFRKDTVIVRDRGNFGIGGYNSISAGVHFLIFGAFAGITLPQANPDVYSTIFGIYTDFPLPMLPMRFNAGFTAQMDGVMDETDLAVPYRTIAHAGAGLAFKLPLDAWLGIGDEPGWFRIGARTSLAPHLLDSYISKLNEASDLEAGSVFDRMAWSFGLMIPY
jgi:hypothetical protein